VQQVCLNGHIITNYFRTYPEGAKKFCSSCGAETITACQSCQHLLRGEELNPSVTVLGFDYPPPAFCGQCGAQHPWTKRKIEAALELAGEIEENQVELERLRASISALAADTPATSLAIVRVKKLLFKAKGTLGPALLKMLMDIGTDEVRRQMGLK
jgi:hypothetical protein